MPYRLKNMLRDRFGDPILQFFDSDTREYKIQPKIATERTLNEIKQKITLDNEKNITAPTLKNVEVLDTNNFIVPQWFHEGLFYGSNNANIYTSSNGKEWELLTTVKDSQVIATLTISDTNRIIATFYNGEVWVSDESQVFGNEPTFTSSGQFSRNFGTTKHGNVIGLCTYTPKSFGYGYEAFLSTDNGETFKKIFDDDTFDTIEPLIDPTDTHLHDIEYDPYSGRIYLWNGDGPNRVLLYSDDWGMSWQTAFPRGTTQNYTQIIATENGLVLGADKEKGGVGFIELDRHKQTDVPIEIANITDDYWTFAPADHRFIATRSWVDRENENYLMGFVVEDYPENIEPDNGKSGYLAYSANGVDWSVLAKAPAMGHHTGFWNVVYGNGILLSTYKDNIESASHELKIFRAEVDLE